MKKETPESLANKLFPAFDEHDPSEDILDVPPEQRKLHTDTYDFSISTILDYLSDGRIYIPEFQRRYVWQDTQASRLIESLIIQCPIPVIYLSQDQDERLSVIDGNQRLTSIQRYLNNEFPLKSLTAYPELEGLRFEDLDVRFRRHIQNRTLRCIVIGKDTHPQVKFDVFERLNSGSVKLTPQELRHGIYYGAFMQFVEKTAGTKAWRQGLALGSKRMKEEELVIRFLAFHYESANYRKPLASFLNEFAAANRKVSQSTLDEYQSLCVETIEKASILFGNFAFRLYDVESSATSSFNAALFDAEMLAISRSPKDSGPKDEESRRDFLLSLQEMIKSDPHFKEAITRATSDEKAVKLRIDNLRDLYNRYS